MRNKILPGLLMLMMFGLLIGCNNDHDGESFDHKQQILLSKYPNAQNLTWAKSLDNKYDIATFTIEKNRAAAKIDTVNVWFGDNNAMRLVKEEISFASLPASVKEAFGKAICRPLSGISDNSLINTRYSDPLIWDVDDIYLLEKDGATSYRIEMETVSSEEIEVVLIYDAQGILLKEYEVTETDDETPLEIPSNIMKWANDMFPGCEILDYEGEMEDGELEHELDLCHNNIIIEVELTEKDGNITVVELEYNYPNLDFLPTDVKEAAIEAINALEMYTIEDVCEIEMEVADNGDEEYEIELRNSNNEIEISITKDVDGIITVK